MLKIALIGHARAGKDTVADMVYQLNPALNIDSFAFASPLKEMYSYTCSLFDFDPNVKDREFLQKMGGWVRNKDPDAFVKILMDKVDMSYADIIIVTDVRYLNEANALRRNGFKLIKLVRPGFETSVESELQGASTHESEMDVDSIAPHVTIINNGDLDELLDGVKQMMDVLLGKGDVSRRRGEK